MFCRHIVNRSNTFEWVANGTIIVGANTWEHRHSHGDNGMDYVWAYYESCSTKMFL
jgi:hypothetical protein